MIDVALGFVKARRQRRRLPEVAAQADHLQVAVGLHQVGQQFEAAVGGGIVHEQDFVGPLHLFQNRGQTVVEREDRVLLVVDRDDDRQHENTSLALAGDRPVCIVLYSPARWIAYPFRRPRPARRTTASASLPVAVLLDNVRSLYNVGAFFRTADAAGLEKLYLCGITGRPPKRAITKTALGAEESVAWEHSWDPLAQLQAIRERGYEIAAVETTVHAVDLFDWTPRFPVCIVFGHEVDGIRPELSALCDTHVRIPMLGAKHSLNVATAGGVVIYELLRKYRALGLALR